MEGLLFTFAYCLIILFALLVIVTVVDSIQLSVRNAKWVKSRISVTNDKSVGNVTGFWQGHRFQQVFKQVLHMRNSIYRSAAAILVMLFSGMRS
jgi:hypothetical protein